MNIRDAAHNLYEQYKGEVWFQTVGMAEPDTLYIYCQKRPPKTLAKAFEFEGFDVNVQYVGKIRAGADVPESRVVS